jgi:hypothetical protein
MSTGQLIFLGLGIILTLSSIDFSALLKKVQNKAHGVNIPNLTPSPSPVAPVIETKDSLVEIVQKWQQLKDACQENKLTEAVTKLDEIFPVLIKVEK